MERPLQNNTADALSSLAYKDVKVPEWTRDTETERWSGLTRIAASQAHERCRRRDETVAPAAGATMTITQTSRSLPL
ncbi:unnamed protein product [Lampetra planeri]